MDPADSPLEGSPGRDRAPNLAQHWMLQLRVATPLECNVTVFFLQEAADCTSLAIAQIKPASSRAIAAVITVGSFPARASAR